MKKIGIRTQRGLYQLYLKTNILIAQMLIKMTHQSSLQLEK